MSMTLSASMLDSFVMVKPVRIAASVAAAALSMCLFSSCDPQAFSLNVEMRYPSKSGLDLAGKSLAVVYLERDSQKDSVFNEYLANGFASSLEKEYFGGEQAVNLYRKTLDAEGDWSSADSLRSLVMSTGDDVVFLFDSPEFGNVSVSDRQVSPGDTALFYDVSVPLKIRLYAYDSMGGKDTVMVWNGSRVLKQTVSADVYTSREDVPEMLWKSMSVSGETVGQMSSKIFMPTWTAEQYTVVYYDTPEAWNKASEAAYDFKWKEAMSIWMTLLDTGNLSKRACAEYDIALACYMLGDNALALKWLDQSDADSKLSLSAGLRKRILARMR